MFARLSGAARSGASAAQALCLRLRTEGRLSDIFQFPRKSFELFQFAMRVTRLALASAALDWR